MTRVLLTGGSGFIATHVIEFLLTRGHSVVTTVRSEAKADQIKEIFSKYGSDKLDFVYVKDIATEGAFDKAVKSSPPFEAVIHTASPFTFAINDVQKDLIDPAVLGTTGILKSIQTYAPTVKKVVITSSFASVINRSKGFWPDHTYSEADWNPTTLEESLENAVNGYYGSKVLAEKAAWKFVEDEKPGFALTTLTPPMVYGPVKQKVHSLDEVNTSSTLQRDLLLGKYKGEDIPDISVPLWVDVRDLALAHVLAIESSETDGQRVFTATGHYNNQELIEIIRKNFPEYADKLPSENANGGGLPAGGVYQANNSRFKKLLGQDFISFEQSTIDLVKTLKELGA